MPVASSTVMWQTGLLTLVPIFFGVLMVAILWYHLSFGSVARFPLLSWSTCSCCAFATVQLLQGLSAPRVIFHSNYSAVCRVAFLLQCPSNWCVFSILIWVPFPMDPLAISSLVTSPVVLKHAQYSAPFLVGMMMPNTMVIDPFAIVIALASPLIFHPFWNILVKLHKL